MKSKKIFPYVRILCALPFTIGVALIAFPFVPMTDDFGAPILISAPVQIGIAALGLCMIAIAIYIAAPDAFRSQK